MADVRELQVKLTGDSSGAKAALSDVGGGSNVAAAGFGKLAGAVAVGMAVFQAAAGIFRVVGHAISEVGNFAQDAVSSTMDLGLQTLFMQRAFGMSAESASSLIAVFKRFGVDTDGANRAMGIFEKHMLDAAEGGGKMADRLSQLGIKVTDANGNLRSMSDVLMDVADAFKNDIPVTERAAVAKELFGRSGLAMIPTLIQGRAGIEALTQKAREMGVVLGQDDVEAVRKLAVAKADLGQRIDGIKTQIGLALIPHITNLLNRFQAWVDSQGGVNAIMDKAKPIIEGIVGAIKGVIQAIPGAIMVLKTMADAFIILAVPIAFVQERMGLLPKGTTSALLQMKSTIDKEFPAMAEAMRQFTTQGVQGAKGQLDLLPGVAQANSASALSAIQSNFGAMPGAAAGAAGAVPPAVGNALQPVVGIAHSKGSSAIANFVQGINSQGTFIQGPTVGVTLQGNNTLRLQGSAGGSVSLQAAGGLMRAMGGIINYLQPGGLAGFPGGPSGTDTVPAWLTPGEFVVRKEAVDAIGEENMQRINQGMMPMGSSRGPDSVKVEVNIGMFAGTPDEYRSVGMKIYQAIVRVAKAEGVSMPLFGGIR